jgi:protein ImuA
MSALEALRTSIEKYMATARGSFSLGLDAIDAHTGGLRRDALHEVTAASGDAEEAAIPAAFAAILALRAAETGRVLWCLTEDDLCPQSLKHFGLSDDRLVVARGRNDKDILIAMEEGLRSKAVASVIGEIGALDLTASRRIQLAAEWGGTTAIAIRRGVTARLKDVRAPSAATSRWRIDPLPSRPAGGLKIVGKPRWRLELLRCRSAKPASWDVEVEDAQIPVALSVELAAGRMAEKEAHRAAAVS